MKQKIYKTKRLEIRPLSLSDYGLWEQACLLPPSKTTNKWDKKPPIPSKELFKKVIKRHQSQSKADQTYQWGVFEKNSKKLVGMVDIHILERYVVQKANLGYRIFNQYWGQGYGKEAVSKIVIKGLLDLKLNRLEAVIDLENKRSIKLVKSIGLRSEGVRKNYWFQNKKWNDQIVFVADRSHFKLPQLKL